MTGELARTEPPTALTDGAAVDLRPQWNLDGKSVVFERHEVGQSRLFQLHLEGWRRGDCEALDFCNREARHVQGRAAFFAQDVFAYVSDRAVSRPSGMPTWRIGRSSRSHSRCRTKRTSDSFDGAGGQRPLRVLPDCRQARPAASFRGELRSGIQQLTIGSREGDQPWLLPGADRLVFHSRRDGDDGIFVRDVEHGSDATRMSPDDERTPFVTRFRRQPVGSSSSPAPGRASASSG